MSQDLNDLVIFVAVVENGSFTAAARALGVAKSQVSTRIARLERRLDMRLIQRTTRQQRVTPFGQRYYDKCRAMVDAAEAAQELAERSSTVMAGTLRVVAPPLFSELVLSVAVAEFMRRFPDVRLVVDQTYRGLNLVRDRHDVGFVVAERIADSSLVARKLAEDWHVLVAAPQLVATRGIAAPEDLAGLPSLSMQGDTRPGGHAWHLRRHGRRKRVIPHDPRLVTDDLLMLRRAACAGAGVVALPAFLCSAEVARGDLQVLLPDWKLPLVDVYTIYPSRAGQPPALRSFIEFSATHVRRQLDLLHERVGTNALRP